MNSIVKSQKGITLIALVITVIILLILAGIGIGELSNNNEDIAQTKDTMSLTELSKVQQVVIENYLKYVQLKNDSVLTSVGEKVYSDEYTEINNTLIGITGNPLKVEFSEDVDKSYYKLSGENLKSLGLENIRNNNIYVVNYSTGEVFNYTQQKTVSGEPLYIYAKNNN